MRPGTTSRHLPKGMRILHEDRDILVIDKPPGLLSMATDSEKERTALHALTDYVRKGNSKSRLQVYIVHRLDREVSGVLVFAKSLEAKQFLQEHWADNEKKYLAVVHGRMPKQADTISSYLVENLALAVRSTQDKSLGRLSHTAYRVLRETRDYSLLEINLLTGRKHQIRVHLAESGHPIVGDRRYGREDKKHKRIALHATSLMLTHPYTGERMTFKSEPPVLFNTLVGKVEPARKDG
ncbi:MAG: RNA pseudouridine synthase [Candidatus Hydrogenedentes bacterium]|nr:RNA pseudouridine synthase [Candidatus Hydrogenedentota bacterium]